MVWHRLFGSLPLPHLRIIAKPTLFTEPSAGQRTCDIYWRVEPAKMIDAKGWRDRAEEARTHAEQMRDPIARRTLLKIAEEYEKLANKAEQRGDTKNAP
jgi:hypothetical protein